MTTLLQALHVYLDYTAWATGRLLEAARELTPEERTRDFGTADKSIEGTLIHLFQAERVWVERMLVGKRAGSLKRPDDSWELILSQWPQVQDNLQKFALGLDEGALSSPLEYLDSRGNEHHNALWTVLMHLVNHATHHRGQISGFLRASGKVPPNIDFINYTRQQGL
jgi:uncharacterized damage-inducible protein DinB